MADRGGGDDVSDEAVKRRVSLAGETALGVAHDGLDVLHVDAAGDQPAVEVLDGHAGRLVSETHCGVEGVHDLVAALLVRDIGERDAVKVDYREDILIATVGDTAINGGPTPISSPAWADGRSQAGDRSGAGLFND